MKSAVVRALNYFKELYESSEVRDPLLEEIELSEDKRTWNITIGFNTVETLYPSALDKMLVEAQGIAGLQPETKRLRRKYRLFQINSEDGTLTSMKNKDS